MTATAEKLQTIVRLALCPSAPQGEWESAAIALIRICRTHSLNPFALSAPPPRDETSSLVMPFGKFKGFTVRWIVENNVTYADWLISTAKNLSPSLRQAFKRELKKH